MADPAAKERYELVIRRIEVLERGLARHDDNRRIDGMLYYLAGQCDAMGRALESVRNQLEQLRAEYEKGGR